MSASDSQSELVMELAEEFLERYRKGQRPPLREYIERHPELAAEIKEVFPAMAMMENIAVADESLEARPACDLAAPPPMPQLGDFRIIREIGHGGMGVVYEAEQVSLGRHVALKVLPQKRLVDARTKQRFEREAKAAAKLHHTNIVPVFGVGEHEGLPYYAMHFIQGMGLDVVLEELKRLKSVDKGSSSTPRLPGSEVCRVQRDVSAADVAHSLLTGQFVPAAGERQQAPAVVSDATVDHAAPTPAPALATGRVSDSSSLSSSSVVLPGSASSPGGKRASYWQSVAHIGVQVAEALEYAHRQGIQHRDIKPSNLLLDMQGTVWVTDFGLAKTDDQQNLTQVGDVLGTLRYMPPEAFEGKSDARGDVYALGLTLYELVAQQPAFNERDRNKLIKQVTTAEPERLGRVRKGIPRDLATIIHKAIDREPGRRYLKAQELAEDLRRFLEDRPVKARRISIFEGLVRWARRNRQVAVALGVIGVLLAISAIASSVAAVGFHRLAKDEEHARQSAEKARRKAEEAGDAERWERYRSNIAAASGALQLQNSGAAGRVLDDAPIEHRNWEWQYLHSQLDGASLVLPVAGGKVKWLALSPSGRQVAVCCDNHNEVYLYDISTGRLDAVLRGHAAAAVCVVYRPDGRQVATSSSDQTIRLWDPATGQQTALLKAEAATPELEVGPLVKYNLDGSRIATYGSFAANNGGNTSRL